MTQELDRSEPPDINEKLAAALESRGTSSRHLLDGRRLRTERGRALVVDTTLAMVDAGLIPTYAEIAAECGLSERTIFRYFPDREALMAALAAEIFPRIVHCLVVDPPDTDLRQRVADLVQLRIELVAISRPFARAVEIQAPDSNLAAALLDLRQEQLRLQIRNWFADALVNHRPAEIGVIDMLLSSESIGQQRTKFDDKELGDALTRALILLLDPPIPSS